VEGQSAARPEVVLSSRAAVDVSAAFEWYELQRKGLGERFLRSVGQSIDRLRLKPNSAPIVHSDIRRLIVPRFPYGMFYVVEENVVVVLAIVHSRRDPKTWPHEREEGRQ